MEDKDLQPKEQISEEDFNPPIERRNTKLRDGVSHEDEFKRALITCDEELLEEVLEL